jgi:hypothetical protein
LKDNLVGMHVPKYMRVDLGRFLEIKRSGEDYEALFENGSIEIPREAVEYVSYYYASPFHRALLLTGAPNDPYVRVIKRDGECYISIPGVKDSETLELKVSGECGEEFVEVFNKSYKALWIKLAEGSGFLDLTISYGNSEDEAWSNLRKAIIDDMIRWVNETGRLDFILLIAGLDPSEAFEAAERYRKEIERKRVNHKSKY